MIGKIQWQEQCNKRNDRKNAQNEACMLQHLFEHFKSEGYSGFSGNLSVTLIDKADRKDPKKKENYWIRALKTHAPFWLNIEDSVWSIPCRNINVTAGFNFLVFFGTSTGPGTGLEQDFSDMTYAFLYLLYLLFPYY